MAIYKFRATFEDFDEVYRDIEIRSTQTFELLHNAIQQAIGFDNKQLASFYMSDDNWKKGKEITLMDMSDDNGVSRPMMKDCKLCDYIADPHQKLLYVFDFLNLWNFQVELLKISINEDQKVTYPRCVKVMGDAPKQYGPTNLGKVSPELDMEELLLEDELIDGEETEGFLQDDNVLEDGVGLSDDATPSDGEDTLTDEEL